MNLQRIVILLSILNRFAEFVILLSILNEFATNCDFIVYTQWICKELLGGCQRPLST